MGSNLSADVQIKSKPCQVNAIKAQSAVETKSKSCQENAIKAPSESSIQSLRKKDQWKTFFNSCKDTNKLVVIDFTAAWCKPCQSMEPTLEELATKYKDICIVKIDVDELPDVAAEYGVQAMPTYLLMKKGNQVDKVVGAKKADLEMKIEKHRKSN